jgi:hypothetical protein
MTVTVGRHYLDQARRQLAASVARIVHCIDQLSDEQLWWRPRLEMNSVANLVLHLCGNLRQWIVAGVTQSPDTRDRPGEFAQHGGVGREELLRRLRDVAAEADAVLARISDAQLLEPRRIQGFDETVLSATFDSLTHLQGHAQEIIALTRLQLGPGYRLAWAPVTPEQGASQ